jgi:hypothetical protein
MQYYGKMPVSYFVQEDAAECRHTIQWPETNIKDGFPTAKPDDIGTDIAWQFGIRDINGNVRKTGWRIHGYVIGTTFYVVWLDPNHALIGEQYVKSKRRGSRGK